jgi:thioredoxin reductase (NADPH)
MNNPKIKFIWDTVVAEILGQEKINAVKLKNLKTNEEKEMQIDGVFVAIGHIPNSAVLKGIDVDEKGYVIPRDRTRTNLEGVFVAGDVHDSHYKQAITAAGFGCMAALDTERWLSE